MLSSLLSGAFPIANSRTKFSINAPSLFLVTVLITPGLFVLSCGNFDDRSTSTPTSTPTTEIKVSEDSMEGDILFAYTMQRTETIGVIMKVDLRNRILMIGTV